MRIVIFSCAQVKVIIIIIDPGISFQMCNSFGTSEAFYPGIIIVISNRSTRITGISSEHIYIYITIICSVVVIVITTLP